jgi:hypothetical protein
LPELSASTIHQFKYHEKIREVLLVLHQGTQPVSPQSAPAEESITGQLLAYVQRHRPRLWWSERLTHWGFAGLTIALPIGYGIFLHPEHVHPTPEGAAIVAHELGHALWNSHGFDSSEEEYYCDRVAGRAYQEILLAEGASAEEATKQAQARFSALVEPMAVWVARRRKNIRRHLLQPWTWFDNSRAADIASNILMGPWVNLGIWGYPVWRTRRDLGK